MDLTKQPPRSPYCTAVLGLMGAARASDKARAEINGTIGEYQFGRDSGLDGRTLGFLALSPDEFFEAVKACPDDQSLSASLKDKTNKTIEEIKAYNESQRNRTPQDEQTRQRFEQRKQNINRPDIKMMSDMLDAEDMHEFGPPTDLTSQPPRSAHSGSLLGIVCLARMADKARAKISGTLGEYKYGEDSGLDRNTLAFIGLTADEFLEGVRQSPDDAALARWLPQRIHKTDAEIAEWNTERRARGPWNDEVREMFDRRANAVGRPDLTTFLELLDMEDAHDFPH
ncbi:MAG: DUF5069 domain-containing protein [Candidatus Poribacteria bacterium]|nr:DUF5069 domain-containing protein [Candidatus Poribacteria bacterium]